MTPSPKPRLLLVDDDEDIRSQMKWALADDYDLALAHDGPGALQAFKQHRPLVTLLDLGLPPRPSEVWDPVRKAAATAPPCPTPGRGATAKKWPPLPTPQPSPRRAAPLVVIIGAAIPDAPRKSNFSANKKASSPGAHAQRKARF